MMGSSLFVVVRITYSILDIVYINQQSYVCVCDLVMKIWDYLYIYIYIL